MSSSYDHEILPQFPSKQNENIEEEMFPPSNHENEKDIEYMFISEIKKYQFVHQILQVINFGRALGESAYITLCQDGIRVSVEKDKCIQASAFLQKSLFKSFELKAAYNETFGVDLFMLMESLSITETTVEKGSKINKFIFGDDLLDEKHLAIKFLYRNIGYPFVIMIVDKGIVTTCKLATIDAKNMIDFDSVNKEKICRINIQSLILNQIWAEMDLNSDNLYIHVNKDKNSMKFGTESMIGSTEVDINLESDMVDSYEVDAGKQASYKMSFIRYIGKALEKSRSTVFFLTPDALLYIMFVIPLNDKEDDSGLVEFFCVPNTS